MRKKNFILFILALIVILMLVSAVSCNDKEENEVVDNTDRTLEDEVTNEKADNEENGGDIVYTYKVTFKIMVRDAYFADVGERNLIYDGKTVCPVQEGIFDAAVEVGSEGFDKNKLATDRANCNFVITEARDSITESEDTGMLIYTVIETEDGKVEDGFMDLGGKVVWHSDGETRVSGSALLINGNVVIADAKGDFNLTYIPIGAKFSVRYEGYKSVDIAHNELPYHIITEGVDVYTFRLVPDGAQ